MSLKHFHIFFILSALGLLGFMAYWAGHRFSHGENGFSLALAAISSAGLAAGLIYLGWFLRKAKNFT